MSEEGWREVKFVNEPGEPLDTSGDVPTWDGQTGMGPHSCPVCGSVGTGWGMGMHLLNEHAVALAEERYEALRVKAVESALRSWAEENVRDVMPVGERTLEVVRAQAHRMGLVADVYAHPDDDRKLVINVKGFSA